MTKSNWIWILAISVVIASLFALKFGLKYRRIMRKLDELGITQNVIREIARRRILGDSSSGVNQASFNAAFSSELERRFNILLFAIFEQMPQGNNVQKEYVDYVVRTLGLKSYTDLYNNLTAARDVVSAGLQSEVAASGSIPVSQDVVALGLFNPSNYVLTKQAA